MKQSADLGSGMRKIFRVDAYDTVDGLCCSQVVANGANAAKALHHYRRFPEGAPLNKALKSSEFDDVKQGFFNFALVVEPEGYPSVAFHAGNRVDYYFLSHRTGILIVFVFLAQHGELRS